MKGDKSKEKTTLSALAAEAATRAGKHRLGAEVSKGGRPSLFTAALGDEICERIAMGEAVRQVCLLPEMPDETTFYRWILKDEAFRAQYRKAKEAQMDRMEESLIEIADDSRNDWVERENERGEKKTVLNDEVVQRAKVRIATRQWLMSKLKPKKYGEKVELSGEAAKTEITVNVALSKERLEGLQRRRREALEGGNN
jgi:hypothetical protein